MKKHVKNKTMVRVLALGLAAVFAVCLLPSYTLAEETRNLSDIQKEIQEKKAHMDELEEAIQANQSNKQMYQQYLSEYEARYSELLVLIDEQEMVIGETEGKLDRKQSELSDTIENIQANKEAYEKRLRALYDMNTTNVAFASLAMAGSFSEMLQLADAMQRISKRDTDLLADLADQKARYEQQKADLEAEIENLTAQLQQLQADRDWANGKVEEMKNNIYWANVNIQKSEEELEFTQEEIDELVAEYNRIFRELQQNGSKEGDGSVRYDGPLAWPVPDHGRISSYFGDPRSNTGYHYGIDIPAATGTPVVSAAPGTVITSTWHYSYGWYIVIDHGGGLRTLYAHCSELYVGAGTWVPGEYTISAVGNTGNSFGAHLHFEVHDKGTRQNPLGSGYLNP